MVNTSPPCESSSILPNRVGMAGTTTITVSAWVTTSRAKKTKKTMIHSVDSCHLLGPIVASGLSGITCTPRGGSVQSSREVKVPDTAKEEPEGSHRLRGFGETP